MRTFIISLFIYLFFNSICFAEITVTHDFQQFLSDTNPITKVSFPLITEFSSDPYLENGVSISQVNGFHNQIIDSSQLDISDLTGNVLKVDGPEHINIKLNAPVFSIGFFIVDGYWTYPSCPESDSKFSILIRNHKTIVGTIDEIDPPVKSLFFIGITTNTIFDTIEIREIGALIDENSGEHCENDFIGKIYTSEIDKTTCFDSDNDGVVNQWDECPETPLGSIITSSGCPVLLGDMNQNGKLGVEDSIKILKTLSNTNDNYTCNNILFTSCKDILESNCSKGNGNYMVDPDGLGGLLSFEVFCDMTTDGGGWTKIEYKTDLELKNQFNDSVGDKSRYLPNNFETVLSFDEIKAIQNVSSEGKQLYVGECKNVIHYYYEDGKDYRHAFGYKFLDNTESFSQRQDYTDPSNPNLIIKVIEDGCKKNDDLLRSTSVMIKSVKVPLINVKSSDNGDSTDEFGSQLTKNPAWLR